jgi:hypothetical protein
MLPTTLNRRTILSLAIMLLTGCRASPAPDAGFLSDSKLLAKDNSIPFNRVWFNPAYRDTKYTELCVAPVNVDYVMAENIWEQASLTSFSPAYVKQNVHLLADYQRAAVIQAVNKYAGAAIDRLARTVAPTRVESV